MWKVKTKETAVACCVCLIGIDGTYCIAVEKKNSMCQAVLLLYYVEWVGAIEVSVSL